MTPCLKTHECEKFGNDRILTIINIFCIIDFHVFEYNTVKHNCIS